MQVWRNISANRSPSSFMFIFRDAKYHISAWAGVYIIQDSPDLLSPCSTSSPPTNYLDLEQHKTPSQVTVTCTRTSLPRSPSLIFFPPTLLQNNKVPKHASNMVAVQSMSTYVLDGQFPVSRIVCLTLNLLLLFPGFFPLSLYYSIPSSFPLIMESKVEVKAEGLH